MARAFFPGQTGQNIRLPKYFDKISGGVGLCNPGGSFITQPMNYSTGLPGRFDGLQCLIAPIPLQYRQDSLTSGATKDYTFSGLINQEVALYCRSPDFNPTLTLLQSNGSQVGTITGSGYTLVTDVGAAGAIFTLPVSDTFTIRVSGGTGRYYVSWSSGRDTTTISFGVGVPRALAYEPSKKLLWAAHINSIDIINPLTMTIIDNISIGKNYRDIIYSAPDGRMCVLCSNGDIDFYKPDRTLTNTTAATAGQFNGLSIDPDDHRIAQGVDVAGGGGAPAVNLVSTDTHAVVATITQGQIGGPTYRTCFAPGTGFYYITGANNLYKASKSAFTSPSVVLAGTATGPIRCMPNGLVYFQTNDGGLNKWSALNPATDIETFRSVAGFDFRDVAYSPCSNLNYMSLNANGFLLINPADGVSPVHHIRIGGSLYAGNQFAYVDSFVYVLNFSAGTLERVFSV